MMYTLYSLPGSCSTGITVLLEKLGVAFETVNRNDVADYKDIVPTNQVPALKTETGQIITEGAAIALYLLEKHGQHLLPESAAEKAEFYQYLMFNYATLHPSYARVFAMKRAVEEADLQKELMQKMAQSVSANWAILEKRLEGREFVVGNHPMIIDYLLAIYTGWEEGFPGITITRGPNTKRLVAKVSALPEFKAAFAREGIEFKAVA